MGKGLHSQYYGHGQRVYMASIMVMSIGVYVASIRGMDNGLFSPVLWELIKGL
jgi:uncharacterized membrane protein YiaA